MRKMPSRLEIRPPRFADDRVPNYKTALSHLEEDDDDDDEDATTQPMLMTKLEMTTQRLGMEFVTIPGREARPFTTIGPIAGVVLFVLIICLTAVTAWLRKKRQRQIIAHNLDKVPLSATTAEGYCPYNIESDGMPAGAYAKLDQPNGRRFPNVRFSQAGTADRAARSDRVRSLCDYDEPQARQPQLYAVSANSKKVKAQRPQSCLIGMGDYDEPEFRIPFNESTRGERQSTVVVNEGAREHTLNPGVSSVGVRAPPQADEIYYSSLKEMESTTPPEDREVARDESTPDRDGVYYSSINLKEQAAASSTLQASNGASLPLVTRPQDAGVGENGAGCELQRPHYFTLDGEDSDNNGEKNMSLKGSNVTGVPKDDEEESLTYDYLQLTDSDKGSAVAPSASGNAHTHSIQSMGYLKLADSHSGSLIPTATGVAPSCAHTVPGQKNAGNEVDGTERVGTDSIYNTLQRGKLQNTMPQCDSDDIYNVLILD